MGDKQVGSEREGPAKIRNALCAPSKGWQPSASQLDVGYTGILAITSCLTCVPQLFTWISSTLDHSGQETFSVKSHVNILGLAAMKSQLQLLSSADSSYRQYANE
jgi:hypothetical protein